MKTSKNTQKLIIITMIMMGFGLAPALSRCAALPEESDISPERQKWLNEQLYKAVHQNSLQDVQRALEDGADPNHVKRGWTPLLSTAIEQQNLPVAKALIQAGANLETTKICRDFMTALHFACTAWPPNPDIVMLLINAGADLNAQGADLYAQRDSIEYLDRSPLAVIMRHSTRHTEDQLYTVIQQLIDANADLNRQRMHTYSPSKQGTYGESPLMLAAWISSPETVRQLILAGADENLLDEVDETRKTLTHYAAENDAYPDIQQAVENVLEERSRIMQQTKTSMIRCDEKSIFKRTYDYLLDGPLPIDSLTQIFLAYTTNTVILLATQKAEQASIRQAQRAEETRQRAIEWQAAQRARRKAEAAAQTCIIL